MLISLLTLGSPEQLTGGYLYHRRIADRAASHDARVEFVPVRRLANPFKEAKGDVVLLDSIAAARASPWGRPRQPLAAIIHQPPGGIDGTALRRIAQAGADRRMYRRCSLLIAASEALRDALIAPPNNFPVDRITVIPPGCDVASQRARPSVDHRDGASVVFLSVGNWMARKGTLELLAAFAAVADPRAVLHLAGRDDVEPRYSKRVRARLQTPDLVGRVIYHGAVAPAEVADLYATADAFVLPSFREPYGTVYGEALAWGLPAVGWRAGNLPHLIRPDVEGMLVEPGDVAGLTAALDRLATDHALRTRMAAAAQRRGQSLPTWSTTATAVFDALRELTTEGRVS
jgi:glycosyltransferase involved in cell wall biosynthesis